MKRASLILAIAVLFAVVARADEFHLKDGSMIVGVIVGYQGNSFRVKTSYGYALVDRDSIASITVSKPSAAEKKAAKSPAPEKAKPATSASSSSASKDENAVTTKGEDSAKSARDVKSEEASATSPQQTANAASNPSPQPLNQQPATPSTKPAGAPPATETSAPIPVREEVQGNLYINDTYGFRIYKPPDWSVIEGARAALPGAVVAMGTSDQTTYLIIGLEPANLGPSNGTLQTHVASTNERLSNMFDDYRPLVPRQTIVAGMHAVEYQFQGMANDQQWSGTVMLLSRGESFFTIFGVTSANTDLVQIQQNVISHTISSLQFTKP
ncbi:MAG TPA: hypothetical protein VGU63_03455 [Candidatus Acidoferrales bacterium]|nr:hypothetical protein [Candidatus Acidoferrales bacterium]